MSGTSVSGSSDTGVLVVSYGSSGGFRNVQANTTVNDGTALVGYTDSSAPYASGVLGSATAATGQTCGVFGLSSSTSGRGVYGWAVADTGQTYGVYGQSDSTDGTGVYGKATAT